MFNQSHLGWLAVWLLRVALAYSFLSAVADRFGLWGQFGVTGVAWGDFERFTAYTAELLWFLPPFLVSPAAILATPNWPHRPKRSATAERNEKARATRNSHTASRRR